MSALAIAADETFKEVEPLIRSIVFKFIKQHGGDFDDALSDAHFAYVKAYNSFDLEKGAKFSSWVYHEIYTALLEQARNRARRNGILHRVHVELDETVSSSRPNPFSSLSESLSEDALTVVNIISSDVSVTGRRTVAGIKKALREKLSCSGWDFSRITRTFEELSRCLN